MKKNCWNIEAETTTIYKVVFEEEVDKDTAMYRFNTDDIEDIIDEDLLEACALDAS